VLAPKNNTNSPLNIRIHHKCYRMHANIICTRTLLWLENTDYILSSSSSARALNFSIYSRDNLHIQLPLSKGTHINTHQIFQPKPTKELHILYELLFIKSDIVLLFLVFQIFLSTGAHSTHLMWPVVFDEVEPRCLRKWISTELGITVHSSNQW